MTYQKKFFKKKYCRVSKILLTGIIFLLCSCSTQLDISVKKPLFAKKTYPPIEDNEPVLIYKEKHEMPTASEYVGILSALCLKWVESCDSATVFSIAKTKIKEAGGNALVVTKFEKPTFSNTYFLKLNGDVFLVTDFSSPLPPQPDTIPSKFEKFVAKHMYIGFGVGAETGISLLLPKFNYYNFQNHKSFETYYGIEASAWIIHALTLSLDCLYGVKKNIFTFDTSVGAFWYPKQSIEGTDPQGPYFHSTVNPKLGVKFRGVWFKAGPSFILYKDYPKDMDLVGLKIGNMYYNFEILIKI